VSLKRQSRPKICRRLKRNITPKNIALELFVKLNSFRGYNITLSNDDFLSGGCVQRGGVLPKLPHSNTLSTRAIGC
jgi:hypothetical protein